MKSIFLITLLTAATALAQSTGDFIWQKKTSTGYQPFPLTPENGKILSWSGGAPVNIDLPNSAVWGSITGTLADQTDLTATLAGKSSTDVQGEEDLVNSQPQVQKKMAGWTDALAEPARMLIFGDSFASGLQRGPKMANMGHIGLGDYNVTGTITYVTGAFDLWTNGSVTRYSVGSSSEQTFGSQANGDLRGDTAFFAYLKKPGGGTFDLQYQTNGTGSWTTLGAGISASNATTIGAVYTAPLPTSNSPFYRLRITNVTGAAVDKVASGIYSTNGGGVVMIDCMRNVGHQLTQAIQTPSAIVTPIWTAFNPDLVISSWLDPAAAWNSGGAFRTFYDATQAIDPQCDWIQIGPNPIDTTAPGNTPPDTDLLTDQNTAQRAWAVEAKQTWVNGFNYLKDWPTANARGLMNDVLHLNSAGQIFRNAHLWKILPLGSYELGAAMPRAEGKPVFSLPISGAPSNAPVQVNANMNLTRGLYINNQAAPYLGSQAWSIQSPTGNLEFGYPGTPVAFMGTSSNAGIHPGFNGAKLGQSAFRWNASVTDLDASGTITGDGAGLTNLPAANLTGSAPRSALNTALAANGAPIVATTLDASGNITYSGNITPASSISQIRAGSSGYFAIGNSFLTSAAAANFKLGLNNATTPTSQTIQAHDVTTGTGADLWLTGGKGSTAGGALVLGTSATNGSPVARLTIGANGNAAFGANLSVSGSATFSSTADFAGILDTRNNLRVMNKAASGFLEWATRDTSGSEAVYNLSNIGSITATGNLTARPGSSVTPTTNGDLTFEATSNTSLTVKLKGTDGTVRSVVLTLAP